MWEAKNAAQFLIKQIMNATVTIMVATLKSAEIP